ncbi:MAG: anti-sigma factor [Candidatus Dormibacteraeota bacterium]|nr:anti-sigma factor [Candidatus Dormibacteraeota bacterium]
MSEHEKLEESVASWLLGAVEAAEAEMLRAHIEACPTCREMASRLGGAVDALPLVVDEVAPPAHLRERILAAAAASPRLAVAPNRTPGRRRSPGTYTRRFDLRVFERIPAYAVAAAVILALVIGVAAGELAGHRPPAPAPSQVARSTLTGHDALAGATASVIELKRDGVALVDFKGLPSLAPGKVYELWLITSNSRADPAAVFIPDSNGSRVLVVSRTLEGYVTMAVTTEQGPDGATVPSAQPQMSGSLA